MAEYSKIIKGNFSSTGAPQVINLSFAPDTFEMWNYTAIAGPAQSKIPHAYWDSGMGQGTAIVKIFNATPVLTTSSILTNGISTFSAGKMLMFGVKQQVIGATAASPIVFNVTAHGYIVGDVVEFEGLYQSTTTGMPQICGMPFRVSAVSDADHFAVIWDGSGSNYTALSGSPTGAYVRKILYPYLYLPGMSFISNISPGRSGSTLVTTTDNHNLTAGQIIAFRIPLIWGASELNSLPNSSVPGSPIYFYVTSVVSAYEFHCSANTVSISDFSSNVPVSSVPGLDFPQVVAVGDVNTGGNVYSGGSLYPSPVFPTYPPSFATSNGPAILGSFVNNTAEGFVIGAGAASSDASSVLIGSIGDAIYWEAKYHDYVNP